MLRVFAVVRPMCFASLARGSEGAAGGVKPVPTACSVEWRHALVIQIFASTTRSRMYFSRHSSGTRRFFSSLTEPTSRLRMRFFQTLRDSPVTSHRLEVGGYNNGL
jgi:hypothetical protein